MRVLARRLGHVVRDRVPAKPLPWRGYSVKGPTAIYVLHGGYEPRVEFTIAHEVMELHAPRDVLGLPGEVKEAWCDRGAAALLLPRRVFAIALAAVGADIQALRARWPLASEKAIVARLTELATYSTADRG